MDALSPSKKLRVQCKLQDGAAASVLRQFRIVRLIVPASEKARGSGWIWNLAENVRVTEPLIVTKGSLADNVRTCVQGIAGLLYTSIRGNVIRNYCDLKTLLPKVFQIGQFVSATPVLEWGEASHWRVHRARRERPRRLLDPNQNDGNSRGSSKGQSQRESVLCPVFSNRASKPAMEGMAQVVRARRTPIVSR